MGRDIADIAKERASQYAPLPAYEPSHAGLAGAFAAVCAVVLVAGGEPLVIGGALVIGFALPFLYFWTQQRRHYDAWNKEYEALTREEEDAR